MQPYYDADGITIYHGDCAEVDEWLAGDVLVTDPPYGIDYRSGWDRVDDTIATSIASDLDTSARDGVLSRWGDRPAIVFGSPRIPSLGPRNPIIWHKPGMGMGDLSHPWRPDYEVVYVLGDGFRADRRGSSVLSFPMSNTTKRREAPHPHAKPTGLMIHLIDRCPPGTIVDPFMGSGSTLVAAKQCGRRAIGVELAERYCEVAASRLAQGVLDFGGAA